MNSDNSRTSIHLDHTEVMATVRRSADEQSSFNPHDHALVYVAKGYMEVTRAGGETECVREGECVFVRKDHKLKLRRHVSEPAGFHLSIFVYFTRKFLFDYYRTLTPSSIPADVCRNRDSLLKIERTPALLSLFESFRPYYYSGSRPDSEWLRSRLTEGLRLVLNTDSGAYASLFNFASRWRLDILEYLEENYMYDLTMEEIAAYTGRSLATFKRDFAKVSDKTPQQWIIQRRLRAARERLLNDNAPIGTIMSDVGFKNFSHFSRIYRQQYGETPSATRRR